MPWAPRPEEDRLRTALLAGGPVTIATEGRGGLGKTALAAKLAADPEICAKYDEGVYWLGLGQTPDVAGLLAALATALGGDVTREADEAGRIAAVAALLRGRRVLLVYDDVWDHALATRLRALAPAAALLTTRKHEVAYAFALRHDTPLAQLTPAAAVALLGELVALDVDAALLARVAAVAGGLPLTLGLLAPLVHRRARMGWDLALLVAQIEQPAFRAALIANTAGLSLADLPPGDAAAFAALAVFGPRPLTFDLPAATAVWAADAPAAEERLTRLADSNLIDIEGGGQFALHQFLYDVAVTELDKKYRTPKSKIKNRNSPYARHASYYLALADRDREDWHTIAAAYPQIQRAWDAVAPDPEQTLAFVRALLVFTDRRGLWRDYQAWAERGLVAARALGRREDEARMLNSLGWIYRTLNNQEQALIYATEALLLWQELGDHTNEAKALASIGAVYDRLDEWQKALEHLRQAQSIQQELDIRADLAYTLNRIGIIYRRMGDYHQALVYYEQARILREAIENRVGLAITLHNIGFAYQCLGDFPLALMYYKQALPLREAVGDRYGQLITLARIAEVNNALGDSSTARQLWALVVAIDKELGHPHPGRGDDVLERVRAELAAQEGGADMPATDEETD